MCLQIAKTKKNMFYMNSPLQRVKAWHIQKHANDKCNKEDVVADVVEDEIHADVFVVEPVSCIC